MFLTKYKFHMKRISNFQVEDFRVSSFSLKLEQFMVIYMKAYFIKHVGQYVNKFC